ncbi:tyrosine-type recombinase/integrase [Chitinilyticum litopenaei]|uniref:tyrosine-type recombinase/integrase n=1 Tax=Chitinilyticum litopenaei TaxID=1121276 RepID=UPI00041FE401|nr:tyrosine-type recombinase/integrase [Chitinilyticum litopenaei]
MAENLLTEKTLKAIRPDDAGKRVKDGGNLTGVVKVSRAGVVSVVFTYRFRSPELDKLRGAGCGSWPEVSLADVRAERKRLRDLVAAGVDPLAQRQRDQEGREDLQREEEAARLAAEREAVAVMQAEAAEAAAPTLDVLYQKWDELHGATLDAHWRAVRQSHWRCHVAPIIGAIKIKDVTTKPLLDHFDKMKLAGNAVTANKVLAFVRQVAAWGKARGYVLPGNPLLDLDPPTKPKDLKARQKAESFDAAAYLAKHGDGVIGEDGEDDKAGRALSFAELVELLRDRLPASTQADTGKCIIRFMLATGVRGSQAVRLRWNWVVLEKRLIIFPAGSMKARKMHHVHLSDFALAQLRQMAAIRTGDFVFPAPIKENDHVLRSNVGNDITARQFHQQDGESDAVFQMRLAKRLQCRRARQDYDRYNLSAGKWTLYDLRRTAATRLCEVTGADWDTIKRVLAHADGHGVTSRYMRFSQWEDRCAALDALGEALEECQAGRLPAIARADNVVALRRA